MATTINKQQILAGLLAEGHRLPDTPAEPLPVLEQFIYGLCREDATPEKAEQAFRELQARFFDWNEVRVSSVREVEEALEGLSNAESRAERLIHFLQEVFETTFSFDLDGLVKKGVKQAVKHLMRYQAADDYLGAWVTQRTLAAHALPVDLATLRVIRRLGLIESGQEGLEETRASLEQLVPRAKAREFTDVISLIADEHCHETDPDCSGCPLQGECLSSAVLANEELAETAPVRRRSR
jgi:endonuclease-3